MTFDTTWAVQSVEKDVAKIDLTVDRIQVSAKMPFPNAPDIKLDSSQLEGAAGPIVEQMKPMLDGLLGQKFAVTVSPLGEVTEIVLPEKLQAVFGGGSEDQGGAQEQDAQQRRRRGGGGGGLPGMEAFSEDGIKQVIKQMILPLPEEDLAPNLTWEQTFQSEQPGAGTQSAETKFTYVGQVDKDGKKVAKIETETELFFEPAEDASTDVEFTDQDGHATILFDPAAGRLVEMVGEQMVVKEMSTRRGDVVQNLTEKVTLRQGKSPEAPAEEKQ
jgi:hypothetical protein